ncbi:MAG: hypothetical protein J6P72_04705 [Firmicutes bacterium]|nr:hypothetical protein [Bacillota bacterium]
MPNHENLPEKDGLFSENMAKYFRYWKRTDHVFRTPTGIRMLNEMYALEQ